MRLKDLAPLGLSIVTLFLATQTSRANAATNRYPSVRPTQKTFSVPDVQKLNVSLLIRSKAGNPLYRLRCAHPGYDGDYSGDFECRLDTTGSDDAVVENTLLVEDARQNKQWPTRGRFFAADLAGKCAAIPEFGATRDFQLRGMKLTLQVLEPIIDTSHESWVGAGDPALKSMTLEVTVRRDPSATRSIAAIVPFPSNPPPQCGIHPGEWPVGALGAVGRHLQDISYFGDPATFTKGNPLPSVNWSTVPYAKPGEWNRDMRTGGRPSHCAAQFNKDATFRGKLIARRFIIHDARLHTKSKTDILDGTVLILDSPINICRTLAPNLSTKYVEAVIDTYKENHTRAPATAISKARRMAIQGEGVFTMHVTALQPGVFELSQLNAYNRKYIGHSVEISGSIDNGNRDSPLAQYNLPELMVDRICLLRKGKPTACSPEKGGP